MDCPFCGKAMIEKEFGGVTVDVCAQGCKGIWLEWMDLVRIDVNKKGCMPPFPEVVLLPSERVARNNVKAKCPRCELQMHLHQYKSAVNIQINECYGCGGFLLDIGELKKLREQLTNDEEMKKYTQHLINDLDGNGTYFNSPAILEQRKTAINNLTNLFHVHYCLTNHELDIPS